MDNEFLGLDDPRDVGEGREGSDCRVDSPGGCGRVWVEANERGHIGRPIILPKFAAGKTVHFYHLNNDFQFEPIKLLV